MAQYFKNVFSDAIDLMRRFFNQNIGVSGITVIVCVLAVTAILLLWNVFKGFLANKGKIVIKWVSLIFLVLDVVLLVYFCLMY